MQTTKRPTIGGILSIIGGAVFIVLEIFILRAGWEEIPPLGLATLAAFLFIGGIFPIFGGIFAFKRKRWRLARDGSIGGTIGTILVGLIFFGVPLLVVISVPALILIIVSKNEFE